MGNAPGVSTNSAAYLPSENRATSGVADLGVTENKLANAAVTERVVADQAITLAKLSASLQAKLAEATGSRYNALGLYSPIAQSGQCIYSANQVFTATNSAGVRVPHPIKAGSGALQVVHGTSGTEVVPTAQHRVTTYLEAQDGTLIPVTFRGVEYAIVPAGVPSRIVSDPIPVLVAAGDTVYTRTFAETPLPAVQLTSAAAIGDTSFQANGAPAAWASYPMQVQIDQGGTGETITVTKVTGTSSPYTYTCAPLTKVHSSGAYAATVAFLNNKVNSLDQPGFGAITALTQVTSGTVTATANGTVAITGAVSIGGTTLTVASVSAVTALPGVTLTLDTAGNAEQIEIANTIGTTTLVLKTPLTKAHSSGATISAPAVLGTFAPIALLGADNGVSVRPKPIMIVGDSIPSGTGYTASGVQTSYATIAFKAAGRPWFAASLSGERANQFVLQANSKIRRRVWENARGGWAYLEYGTNDLNLGRTVSQLQADNIAIAQALKALGMKVAWQTLLPRSTSGDSWATLDGQVIWTYGAQLEAYNTWVRAGAGGYADAVIDLVPAVGDTTGSFLRWKAGGSTATAYTEDGIHPSVAGHLALAAVLDVNTLMP